MMKFDKAICNQYAVTHNMSTSRETIPEGLPKLEKLFKS